MVLLCGFAIFVGRGSVRLRPALNTSNDEQCSVFECADVVVMLENSGGVVSSDKIRGIYLCVVLGRLLGTWDDVLYMVHLVVRGAGVAWRSIIYLCFLEEYCCMHG